VTKVEYYENSSGDMIHFFLAREPHIGRDGKLEESPAADVYNGPTVSHLCNLLKALGSKPRPPLLSRLCDYTKASLMQFFMKVTDVGMVVAENGDVLVQARGAAAAKHHLRLLTNEVIYDGATISLARPDDFKILIDVIQTEENMLVLADIPMPPGSSNLKCDCQVKVSVDAFKHELTIVGMRTLYYQKYAAGPDGRVVLSSDCQTYSRDDDTDTVTRIERKYGTIERKVPIPEQYSDVVQHVKLEHGQLQILIPPRSATAVAQLV